MNLDTSNTWRSFLREQIPNQLPGEEAHIEMMPMRGLSSEALKLAPNPVESAVAIHLIQREKDLDIILTKRNTYRGAHSGQVSFPGGKKDPNDLDTVYTARRESYEEVAIPFEQGELIGALTDIYIPVSNFHVKPYVFYHEEFTVKLKPEPREVASIFHLPGEVLVQETSRSLVDIPMGNNRMLENVPCFKYQDYIIWGATAILLNELKIVFQRKPKFLRP